MSIFLRSTSLGTNQLGHYTKPHLGCIDNQKRKQWLHMHHDSMREKVMLQTAHYLIAKSSALNNGFICWQASDVWSLILFTNGSSFFGLDAVVWFRFPGTLGGEWGRCLADLRTDSPSFDLLVVHRGICVYHRIYSISPCIFPPLFYPKQSESVVNSISHQILQCFTWLACAVVRWKVTAIALSEQEDIGSKDLTSSCAVKKLIKIYGSKLRF